MVSADDNSSVGTRLGHGSEKMCRKFLFCIVFYHSLGGHRVSTKVLGYIYS